MKNLERERELDALESMLRAAHRRLDERGVPRIPRVVVIPSPAVQRLEAMSRTGPIEPVGEWAERAACKGQNMCYDQFPAVSHRPTRSDRLMESHALATCRECPVLWECREWSLQPVEPAVDHVAGGLTPRERHEIRARRERLRSRVQAARGWL